MTGPEFWMLCKGVFAANVPFAMFSLHVRNKIENEQATKMHDLRENQGSGTNCNQSNQRRSSVPRRRVRVRRAMHHGQPKDRRPSAKLHRFRNRKKSSKMKSLLIRFINHISAGELILYTAISLGMLFSYVFLYITL